MRNTNIYSYNNVYRATHYNNYNKKNNRSNSFNSSYTRRVAIPKTFLFIPAAIFILISMLFVFTINAKAAETKESYKYYTSITVEDGDTLWSLADEYITVEYKNKQAYIDEVRALNHINMQGDIVSGSTLVMPYYSSEYK